MYTWTQDAVNIIKFVMVDSSNVEVADLGTAFTLEICKPGGAFVGSAGAKAEISNGWYQYTATADEADTLGLTAIRVTGAGCIQQNLAAEVTDGVALSTTMQQAIADEILKRGIAHVEDAADATSLAALVLAAFEATIVGTVLTIRKTDGTTFATKTVTLDGNALPITGIT